MAIDLRALISAIPTAEDGHVITEAYHNTLRSAVLEIGRLMGASATEQALKVSFVPAFFKNGNPPTVVEWNQLNGVATAPNTKSCSGVLPLGLPAGGRIQSLTVSGRRRGSIDGFQVKLVRQAITGTSLTSLISIPLEDQPDPFTLTHDIVELPDLGSSALRAAAEDFRLIDPARYKYLVIATADNPQDLAVINFIQLSYTK